MTILLENEENASFGFPIQEQLELLTEYVLDHEKFPYEAEVSVSIAVSYTHLDVYKRQVQHKIF